MQGFSEAVFPLLLRAVGSALALPLAYCAFTAVYNLYFHPLRNIPGPKLYAAFRLPYTLDFVNGDLVKTGVRLHEKYGEVVRVAPDELSFICGETAWRDIYGFRGSRRGDEFGKDLIWYRPAANGVRSMISASREDHSRQRRAFGYAFSERALREQEPLVQQYVHQLLSRLQEKAGQVVDLVRYYNYTTFDIIGDLTFNEPFDCLKNDDYNAFVSGVFASVKAVSFRSALAYYKWFERLYFWLKPSGIQKGSVTFFDFTSDVVDRRLDAHIHRPDVISFIERQPEGKSLSVPELKATCFTMLIAGSETTATALSGTTYLLLKNPQAMKRLADEIRGRFRSQSEICFESTSKLPFLHAVINEGLRMYPPVPSGFPRRVPAGGSMISGYYAPGNTAVYVAQYPAYRSKRNFTEPNSFIPERWLGEDARFDNDKFDVFMPFSNGPRNCIGKNLAYAEMHVILATVVFNFDLELVDQRSDWMDQKCFNLWDKPALGVRITPSRI